MNQSLTNWLGSKSGYNPTGDLHIKESTYDLLMDHLTSRVHEPTLHMMGHAS
jgi:hypothetical protein